MRPQLVFLPGAWHTSSCSSALISELQSLDYRTHTGQLPSVGNPDPPKDLSEDIATVRFLSNKLSAKATMLSYFRIAALASLLAALQSDWARKRESNGKKSGIVRTGYIASFILPEGVSRMDAVGGETP